MKKKKVLILYNGSRDNQITTGAKLLDIKQEFNLMDLVVV